MGNPELTDDHLRRLAVFPLSDVVLFPHTALPLHVFEPRYRALVETCLERDTPLAVWQLDARAEPTSHGPPLREVATVGWIGLHQPSEDGRSNIIVEGVERVRLVGEKRSGEPYRTVVAERHPLHDAKPQDFAERIGTLQEIGLALAAPHPRAARLLQVTVRRCESPGELSDVLCSITHDEAAARQRLLELSDVGARLDAVIARLSALVLQAETEADGLDRH